MAEPLSLQQLRAALPNLPVLAAGRLRSGRDLLRSRDAVHREPPLPTGLAMLDRLLGGGLERGALTELVGSRSSGRFAVGLAALAAATAAGEAAALVDLGGHLDPQTALGADCDLARLLWVRPERLREALASAEMLLVGGFPLVVLDLGEVPVPGGRGTEAAWLRLARAAQTHGAALLVAAPYRVSGTAAAAVLRGRGRAFWSDAGGGAPRLLDGLGTRLELEKARHRLTGPQDHAELRLRIDPGPSPDIDHQAQISRPREPVLRSTSPPATARATRATAHRRSRHSA